MELTRREFLKESLATLWFLALPGGLFAAPFLDEHSGEPWMAPGAKPFFVVRHVAPQRVLCAETNVLSDLELRFSAALTSTGTISVPRCTRKSISTVEWHHAICGRASPL
ncbi:MAG: hypothetical protein IKO55_18255 [Kiritimatiellae bacterium]|nr:hypothetical protein [Kiritimatiellia bacterium]